MRHVLFASTFFLMTVSMLTSTAATRDYYNNGGTITMEETVS